MKLLCALVVLAAFSRTEFHSRGHRMEVWIVFEARACLRGTLKIEENSSGVWMAEFSGVDLGRMPKTLSICTCRRQRRA
jgi:hypothetical protein